MPDEALSVRVNRRRIGCLGSLDYEACAEQTLNATKLTQTLSQALSRILTCVFLLVAGHASVANASTGALAPSIHVVPASSPGSTSQIVLSWNTAATATSYNVYRGTTAGGESPTAVQTGLTATTYTDTSVSNGATYYYQVTAVNASGESPKSNEAHASTPTAFVSFVQTDTSTQGNWKGVYGVDGWNVVGDTSSDNPSYPAYASVNPGGASTTVWSGLSTSASALENAAPGATTRVAAALGAASLSIDVNLTDANSHQVALYCLDGASNASETVTIADAGTNDTLDTRSVTAFTTGKYLVWNITGHVTITVASLNANNAVVNGLFFGAGDSTAPTTTASIVSTTAGVATITLSATDPDNTPANQIATLYSVDGGVQQTYTTPITVTAYGSHSVAFHSVDASNVAEAAQTQNFSVAPILQDPIVVSPKSVTGGTGAVVTVTLTGPAPVGGAKVTLSSNLPAVAKFTATSITIPAGSTSGTANVVTFPDTVTTSVTLTAKYGVSHTTHLTVLRPKLVSIGISPTSLYGGATSTGTLTLTGPTAVDTTVAVSTDNAAATIVGSAVVPAGSSTGTFTIKTTPVTTLTATEITAVLVSTDKTKLTIKSPTVNTVTFTPSTVTGGGTVSMKVALKSAAPTGGQAVAMTYPTNGSTLVSPPSTVTVAAGSSSVTVTVHTTTVATSTPVTATATIGAASVSGSVTVNP